MKTTLMFFLAVLLAACSTPGDLKAGNPEPAVFKVKAGYQLVLKRLVDQYAECAGGPILPIGQVINDVQNYADLRQATITRGASGFGTQTHQVIEIRETAPNETEVKLYQRFAVAKFGALYERWSNGGSGCE